MWCFSSKPLSSFPSREVTMKFTVPKARIKVHKNFKSDKRIRDMLIWAEKLLQSRAGCVNHPEITDSPSQWHSSDSWGKVIFPKLSFPPNSFQVLMNWMKAFNFFFFCLSFNPSLRASCKWLSVWEVLHYGEVQLLRRNAAERRGQRESDSSPVDNASDNAQGTPELFISQAHCLHPIPLDTSSPIIIICRL